ncbi:MAG TPA: DUF3800 domain-containing protein [Anaerolineae bacterium]|nr:DUF3800 domain-containing protein [Anaerolineae bacterium]
MRKLYCYVDESGQDTRGNFFVAVVIVLGAEREELRERCEVIERETGKGRAKWIKSHHRRRIRYLHQVLRLDLVKRRLYFSILRDSRAYTTHIVNTLIHAINAAADDNYRATIFIDGLSRTDERWVSQELHASGIRVRKVRGVKQDENDALIRLTDSLCGLIRGAAEGQKDSLELFEHASAKNILVNLLQK